MPASRQPQLGAVTAEGGAEVGLLAENPGVNRVVTGHRVGDSSPEAARATQKVGIPIVANTGASPRNALPKGGILTKAQPDCGYKTSGRGWRVELLARLRP